MRRSVLGAVHEPNQHSDRRAQSDSQSWGEAPLPERSEKSRYWRIAAWGLLVHTEATPILQRDLNFASPTTAAMLAAGGSHEF